MSGLKCTKNRIRLGLGPRLRGAREFTALPRPSWNKGDLLLSEGEKYKNEKGRTGCRKGRGEDETGGEGSGGDPPYVSLNFP